MYIYNTHHPFKYKDAVIADAPDSPIFSKRLILRRLSCMMNVVILYSIVKHIYCVYTFRRMLGCIKSLESQLLHTMMVTMTIMEAVITMMLFIFF